MPSFSTKEGEMAARAIGLSAMLFVDEASKVLLAVLAAEVLCVVGAVVHADALSLGDGALADAAEEALALVEVALAVRVSVLAREERQRLEGVWAHGALEAGAVPHAAHRLDLCALLHALSARCARRREHVFEVALAVRKPVRALAALRPVSKVFSTNLFYF